MTRIITGGIPAAAIELLRERLPEAVVISCDTGRELIDEARSIRPDAIVVSHSLDDPPALGLVRLLANSATLADVPVVYALDPALREDMVQDLVLGFRVKRVIGEPVSGEELADAIASVGLHARPTATVAGPEPAPALVLVTGDDELGKSFTSEAARHGYKTTVCRGGDVLTVGGDEPRAAVIDLDGPAARLQLIEKLSGPPSGLPVIALVGDSSLTDRVEVVRRGAGLILERSLSPAQIFEVAERQFSGAERRIPHVLVVDSDEAVLGEVQTLFRDNGMRCTTLRDETTFWDALEECAPDLIVVADDLPEISGVELCHVVRTDPRWASLPVIILAADPQPAGVRIMFAVGADDFVTKPLAGPELITRAKNRLERIKLLRDRLETEPLTMVATRRKSGRDIEKHIRMATRYGQPLSIALIDVDRFKEINDRHGHAAGDRVLKALGGLLSTHFRGEDIVGRFGDDEFVIAMYGMERRDGLRRLHDVRDSFALLEFPGPAGSFAVSFSGGVVQLGPDGSDLPELYRSADRALADAKSSGRGTVIAAQEAPATLA